MKDDGLRTAKPPHPSSFILLSLPWRGSSEAEQTAHNRWVESSILSPATRKNSQHCGSFLFFSSGAILSGTAVLALPEGARQHRRTLTF